MDRMISKGVKWPLTFKNGRVETSSGDQHVKEGVSQLLTFARGEYLMRPQIGCDLHRRAFDPINQAALAEHDIRSAISSDPRVIFIKSSVDPSRASIGQLSLSVDIRIADSNRTATVELPTRR